MTADTDVLKIPVELDVSDKELTSLAKSLTQVTKGVSKSLEASMQSIAFRLQQSGWKNKGDITDKILSYVPQGQKINEIARRSLSAAVGRGKGLSLEHTRTQRILAAQQARAEVQAERQAKAAVGVYERHKIAQDLREAKQIQTINSITNKSYAANTKASMQEAIDRQQIEELQSRFDVLQRYRGMYGVSDKYTKNLTNLSKDVKSINKSTKGEYKELKTLGRNIDKAMPTKATGGGAAIFSKLGKFAGPAALAAVGASILNYIGKKFGEGLKAGEDAFTQHAIYGGNRNVAMSKMFAARWGISEEAAAQPQIQALDFRQRMMWGQVSDNEIIGLSRMGRYGQMIMSGAAARNPQEAYRALYEFVHNNDRATVRNAFNQAGLSLDLMKALQIAPTFDSYYKNMKIATDMEEASAFMNMRLRGAKNLGEEMIRSSVGPVAKLYNSLDPEGKRQAKEFFSSLGPEYNKEWINKYIEGAGMSEEMNRDMKSLGIGRLLGIRSSGARELINSLWNGDVKNEVTVNITGVDEKKAADEVLNKQIEMTRQAVISKGISDIFGGSK